MRYSGSMFKKGGAVKGHIVGYVRKAIGYLQNQLKLSGHRQGRYRTLSPDGVPIDVSIVGDLVIGRAGDDEIEDRCTQEACEVSLFNGLLDLGTPSNPTAHKRFKLFPTDAEDQIVYKGGTSACNATLPSTTVKVTTLRCERAGQSISFRTVCPDDEPTSSVESVITATEVPIATKKKIQDRCPASMFTGLMRHYVQALYGDPAAEYDDIQQGLVILTTNPDFTHAVHWWEYAGAAHMVILGRKLYLCLLTDKVNGEFQFFPMTLTTCGASIWQGVLALEAIRATRALTAPEIQQRTVLATYALVGALPAAAAAYTATLAPAMTDEKSPSFFHIAWGFDGTNGVSVRLTAGEDKLRKHRITIERDEDGAPVMTAVLDTEADYPFDAGWFFKYISYDEDWGAPGSNPQIRPLKHGTSTHPQTGVSFDCPVVAFYDIEDALVEVAFQYSVSSGQTGTAASNCAEPSTDFECQVNPTCTNDAKQNIHFVTSGYVVRRHGAVIYSSVAVAKTHESPPSGLFVKSTGYAAGQHKNAAQSSIDGPFNNSFAAMRGIGPEELRRFVCEARVDECEPNRDVLRPTCTLEHFVASGNNFALDVDPCQAFSDACFTYAMNECLAVGAIFERSCWDLEATASLRVWTFEDHTQGEFLSDATRSVLVSPLGDAAAFVVRSVTGSYTNLDEAVTTLETIRGTSGSITTNQIKAEYASGIPCGWTIVGDPEECGLSPEEIPTWSTDYACSYTSQSDDRPIGGFGVVGEDINQTASCASQVHSISSHTYKAALFNSHNSPLMVRDESAGVFSTTFGEPAYGFCGASAACYIGETTAATGSATPIKHDDFSGEVNLFNSLVFVEGDQNGAWPLLTTTRGVMRVRTSAGGATVFHNAYKQTDSSERMELESVDHGYPGHPTVVSPSWIGVA